MSGKRPRPQELRALSGTELSAQLEKLKEELWQHRINTTEGAKPQVHEGRAIRRQLARILTIMREQVMTSARTHDGGSAT
jgi:ribosomal protein L29